MCGIAGLIAPGGADRDALAARLREAVRVQHHRGPDSNGVLIEDKLGFAHNRLSILDLSAAGDQPMVARSGNAAIVYNGEVYNFREISAELGLKTRSGSDTEVILAGYEAIGPDIFARLNGMFAFALHDRRENAVWLVRDRLGIKPLYLKREGGRTIFASEIKGVLALSSEAGGRLRIDALGEWAWFGNALGERTLYEDIDQLPPGTALRVSLADGETTTRTYWSLADAVRTRVLDPAMCDPRAAALRTREVVEASVKRQLVSDVPVGVFLSGGIDSSSIACLASRSSERSLTTYSAAFDDDDSDRSELALAAEVAAAAGTDHHEFRIRGGETADIVQRMVEAHDLPFSDAANIPLFLMCEAVAGSHKVILQGDAGDEMFAGYQRYLTLLRVQDRRAAFRAFRSLAALPLPGQQWQRTARMIAALGAPTDAETMALLLTVERQASPPTQVFGRDLRAQVERQDPFHRYRVLDLAFAGRPLAEKMLLVDKAVILPDIFFQKVDRSTMAASVEVRVPFADNAILDHVLAISPEVLMTGGRQKGLLRDAMADVLPASVLAGRKRGFGVPFESWATGALLPLLRDSLAHVSARHPGLLDRERIERLVARHQSGRADHGFLIWKVLNFCLWLTVREVAV